mmetsp:Transcript_58196/g.189674  ORF Transcript_58196/g.189674 Transcript_58196/m.189674 type:complete len:208 (-) Transcript_58196:489-1112(-)
MQHQNEGTGLRPGHSHDAELPRGPPRAPELDVRGALEDDRPGVELLLQGGAPLLELLDARVQGEVIAAGARRWERGSERYVLDIFVALTPTSQRSALQLPSLASGLESRRRGLQRGGLCLAGGRQRPALRKLKVLPHLGQLLVGLLLLLPPSPPLLPQGLLVLPHDIRALAAHDLKLCLMRFAIPSQFSCEHLSSLFSGPRTLISFC